MPKKLPQKSPSEPPSLKVRLGWIEFSGTGTLGVVGTIVLVLVIWGARYLPV